MFRQIIKPAVLLFIVLSVLCGVLYPHLPERPGGCFAQMGTVPFFLPVASALIGQPFHEPKYFWGRPSATSPPYDAANSSGSNLGPGNPALVEAVRRRIAALRAADPDNRFR